MSAEKNHIQRAFTVLAFATVGTTLLAQGATTPASSEPFVAVTSTVNYAMVALAVVQVVMILALSGILRTLSDAGGWKKYLASKRGPLAVLIPAFLLLANEASAQAYQPPSKGLSNEQLFLVLVLANVVLFILLMAQINVLRGMTKAMLGEEAQERVAAAEQARPSWVDDVLKRLTRRKPMEQEQDILMHHEYDGIRELDNVLPPWWLWLFYGCVIWGVVYLVNVHVIDLWPQQRQEYDNEMTQAKADVEAYLAAQKSQVDEMTVTLLTDAGELSKGADLFKTNCATCHGQLGEGTAGPNLTDDYWLHGGGIKEVFTTVKYGVQGKAMRAWKDDLKPTEMQAVASYVLSLRGTNPPNAKAPEGPLWQAVAAPDSLAVPADTTHKAADTTGVATL